MTARGVIGHLKTLKKSVLAVVVFLTLTVRAAGLPQDAPFVLQGKAGLADAWRDLDDVVRTPDLWSVPLSSDRFFRATFRW